MSPCKLKEVAISTKTRKTLWARAAGRCALCKTRLVEPGEGEDDNAIVGDECHIRSKERNGPRFDVSLDHQQRDSESNLILLCKTHHKLVDDQVSKFDWITLTFLKAIHEDWVERVLHVSHTKAGMDNKAIVRRLKSGKEVVDVIANALAFDFNHDEISSEEEADLVGGFLQNAQDCGDLYAELEAADRVRTALAFKIDLESLEAHGFGVFGSQEISRVVFGSFEEMWPVAYLRVVRLPAVDH